MQKSGYFSSKDASLYGTLYLPDKWQGGSVGALICEPFGEEKRCSFRMLVRLAKFLAQNGVPALRFDLRGTGDSSCEHGETTWNDWKNDVCAAIDFLKNNTGNSKIALLGFRAGAMLAANIASQHGLCQSLSLIEPVLSGSDLLNDLERRQRIKNFPESTIPLGGYGDYSGFIVSPQMREELLKANLLNSITSLPSSISFQLIRVSGGKTFPPAWASMVEQTKKSPSGEALLVQDKPFWGQVDYFESDSVIKPIANFLLKLR